MARPAVRIQVVEFGVLVGLALLVGRAVQVQILHGRRWAEEAQAQRTERIVLQARRGTLYDRHGTPLAVTQETYHVGIAPNELRDPVADGALISRRLGLTARTWQQAVRRRYAYFAGPFSALEVQPLRSVRGVHFEPVPNRFYPAPDMAHATIGRVGDDGHGASGLEKTLDSLLAGRAGAAVVLKDRAGREYESPARVIAGPEPGLDIVLTLDAELQEIAQRSPIRSSPARSRRSSRRRRCCRSGAWRPRTACRVRAAAGASPVARAPSATRIRSPPSRSPTRSASRATSPWRSSWAASRPRSSTCCCAISGLGHPRASSSPRKPRGGCGRPPRGRGRPPRASRWATSCR